MEMEAQSSRDDEETPIREKLSRMSLEELLQLKEQLGVKVFDEAMFGSQDTGNGPQSSKKHLGERSAKCAHEGRRVKKNKPLEMSSKIQPRKTLPAVAPIAVKPKNIDPRFDSLCGEFRKKVFKEYYGFLDEMRDNELKTLEEQLEDEPDEDRKKQMRFLIQRMKNQDREKDRLKKKEKKAEQRRNAIITQLEQGIKPVYHNKSELRALDLIEQYKELNSTNGLTNHLAKQRKKSATKARILLEHGGKK